MYRLPHGRPPYCQHTHTYINITKYSVRQSSSQWSGNACADSSCTSLSFYACTKSVETWCWCWNVCSRVSWSQGRDHFLFGSFRLHSIVERKKPNKTIQADEHWWDHFINTKGCFKSVSCTFFSLNLNISATYAEKRSLRCMWSVRPTARTCLKYTSYQCSVKLKQYTWWPRLGFPAHNRTHNEPGRTISVHSRRSCSTTQTSRRSRGNVRGTWTYRCLCPAQERKAWKSNG